MQPIWLSALVKQTTFPHSTHFSSVMPNCRHIEQ
jgi:hypothetical protein